jgi:hypothetical protein
MHLTRIGDELISCFFSQSTAMRATVFAGQVLIWGLLEGSMLTAVNTNFALSSGVYDVGVIKLTPMHPTRSGNKALSCQFFSHIYPALEENYDMEGIQNTWQSVPIS